jgi:hypothetical protein
MWRGASNALVLIPAAAQAEKRIAFVVGIDRRSCAR